MGSKLKGGDKGVQILWIHRSLWMRAEAVSTSQFDKMVSPPSIFLKKRHLPCTDWSVFALARSDDRVSASVFFSKGMGNAVLSDKNREVKERVDIFFPAC